MIYYTTLVISQVFSFVSPAIIPASCVCAAFSTVIQELWHADSEDRVVNTTALKSQIQRFTPRFMGYCQQDAQEFLRYLLEGLHEDVNRITVKPKPNLADVDDQLK